MLKNRIRWKWFAVRRTWSKYRHGIEIGYAYSMLSQLGKGRFVSVYRRGNVIEIVDEATKEKIRLIPYQPNHGVMVERVAVDGHSMARYHCDFGGFIRYLERGEQMPNVAAQ